MEIKKQIALQNKEACCSSSEKKLSFSWVKSHLSTMVQRNMKIEWEKASNGKIWNKEVVRRGSWRNIQTETVLFRFETGHDFLAKHLKKLKIIDANKCTLCETGEQNGGHSLGCSNLQDM
jgi:hypothetical protein